MFIRGDILLKEEYKMKVLLLGEFSGFFKFLKAGLQENGMEIGDTHYVNAHSQGRKEWNLLTFSSTFVDNNSETVATKQLYHIAKTFLIGMRDFT